MAVETIREAGMFLRSMRHETVTIAAPTRLDWKALGYLISIVSVLFLGAVAWTKENPPSWYYPVLVLGMVMSIAGMGCRYLAHLRQKQEIQQAQRKSERHQPGGRLPPLTG